MKNIVYFVILIAAMNELVVGKAQVKSQVLTAVKSKTKNYYQNCDSEWRDGVACACMYLDWSNYQHVPCLNRKSCNAQHKCTAKLPDCEKAWGTKKPCICRKENNYKQLCVAARFCVKQTKCTLSLYDMH